MGEAVEKGDIAVYTVTLQVHDRCGEWVYYSVEMNETKDAKGQRMLFGELPSLPIPGAVSESLPWKKKMDREFQRCIVLKYVPESLRAHLEGCLLTGLTVHMIPLKNWQGRCGWRG